MKQSTLTLFKTVVAVVAVGAAAAYVYKQWTATTTSSPSSGGRQQQPEKADSSSSSTEPGTKPKFDVNKASREDVLEVLSEIKEIQKALSETLRVVGKRILEEDLNLDEAYFLVASGELDDPLARKGISVSDFDALLDRFRSDQEVHDAVMDVVQGPEVPPSAGSEDTLTVDRLVEINAMMLEKFEEVLAHFRTAEKEHPERKYNQRTVSVTAQTVVGACVQRRFKVTPDEVEAAMMTHQVELSMRSDFLRTTDQIQRVMGECMQYQ
eukprot:Protomagalhaensia_sp_Gyna_25__4808@NODE_490_length_3284_cov_1179_605547_g381_i0_p2_GENE_NODE_490_length_3284_cov_1179_605547_g381_i0NODE_490_length_3284_cov_1179_605547_g381_i0_p2_ORF_typecomplete_len267_score59_54HemX/PF04375_14/0_068DUF1160/PF06648_11/0_15KKLCAg1/PF15204_6/0_18_NODE_490_length_3284_cov_1179_605547_g381_i04711271